jgi:phosphotransferase system enzyme I (PtsI)
MVNIGLSKGIAIGNAFVLKEKKNPDKLIINDVESEILLLTQAIQKGISFLDTTLEAMEDMSEEQQEIIETHKMLLQDDAFHDKASHLIRSEYYQAEYAAFVAVNELAEMFRQMDNAYFQERAADMLDIGWYVIDALRDHLTQKLTIQDGVIIIAKDLSPADTVKLDMDKVAGIVTEHGGPTSHTAIIARSMEIPAVRFAGITEEVESEDKLIVDGNNGTVHIKPSDSLLEEYQKKQEDESNERQRLSQYMEVTPKTLDGHVVKVSANIVAPNVVNKVHENGGVGVGLYRSEFLYMESHKAPSEGKQFEAYKQVAEAMKGEEVVVRTLDVGGDKAIDYLKIKHEDNPFLGYRAIRYCLGNIPLFKTQIRALLRASAYGAISIMLPMIGTMEELEQSKGIIEDCKQELHKENIDFNKDIKVGIMIEVPSAAILSEALAKEVDFFSIGTNDLIGYTMAADRMNQSVSYLYQEVQPAVLNLIKMTIDNGHKAGIPVSMCGNSAANQQLIPLYLGMGLDKFSVNPSEILKVKQQICSLNMEECRQMASRIIGAGKISEVLEIIAQ